ncbi:MAG: biotin attachment protein [Chloroflexi bacterium]|nr:biotin attachment protein [Chloroflexota bacterium]|tara:strand:+ start:637 stop:864 length:228 start_codon:yes stop_codon:yes gene_type:complete
MDIILPNIGETVDEGKVIKWLKQVGDQVADGDVVCEVETDKSTMEVPTTIAGTIKEIKVKEGEIVPVGSILAIVE